MSAFTGTLVIEEIKPGRLWRLCEPIRYEAGAKGSGRWIVIDKGFVTDGATIPAFVRLFLAVWGTYGRAACLHDYGYSLLRAGFPHPNMPSRKACDDEFHRAMIACGTRPLLALLMWAAVRLCGWMYFRRTT